MGEMASLHCCLIGFDARNAHIVQSLTRLFRSSLIAEWTFAPEQRKNYDLLLCDIDSPAGNAAWQESRESNMPCAAVTAGSNVLDGQVVRKPLRGNGPNSLIEALNWAATRNMLQGAGFPSAEDFADEAPAVEPESLPPSGTTPPAMPGGPIPMPPSANSGRVFSVTAGTAFSPAGTAAAPPQPAEAPPLPEALPPPGPAPGAGSGLDAAPAPATLYADPFRPAAQAMLVPPAPVPAVPAPAVPAPPAPVPAPPAAEPPAAAEAPAPPQAQQEGQFRSLLIGMSTPASAPTGAREDYLTLLRRLQSEPQVTVLHLHDGQAICVAPAEKLYYSHIPLRDIDKLFQTAPIPARVSHAASVWQGRADARCDDVPSAPLAHLLWLASLRCAGPEEVARHEGSAFRLKRWPDLASLPHERYHVPWCGMLARRPLTLSALATATNHAPGAAAAFLAACGELGIVERSAATVEAAADARPPSSGKTHERMTIFRSFLNRLGFGRS